MLLAEMPAVVGPHDDDRIVCEAAFIERVQHAAQHVVGEIYRSQVGLHGAFPLPVLDNGGVVSVRIGHFYAGRRDIPEVGVEDRRNLNRLQRKAVEVALRNVPGKMRPEQSECQEERLLVLFPQLGRNPVGNLGIAHFANVNA